MIVSVNFVMLFKFLYATGLHFVASPPLSLSPPMVLTEVPLLFPLSLPQSGRGQDDMHIIKPFNRSYLNQPMCDSHAVPLRINL